MIWRLMYNVRNQRQWYTSYTGIKRDNVISIFGIPLDSHQTTMPHQSGDWLGYRIDKWVITPVLIRGMILQVGRAMMPSMDL